MRVQTLSLVALCSLALACSSTTDEGDWDQGPLDYSLSDLDGEALPGPLSSLPGLVIWQGDDDTTLTVATGELSCAADGTAAERYLFRLSWKGSAVWDPIWVNLDVTCEATGPGSFRIRDRRTGEVREGTSLDRFDGCHAIEKKLPSVQSLRAGYASANSGADFPTGWEFSGPARGEFVDTECIGF